MSNLKDNLKDPITTKLGLVMVGIALLMVTAPGFIEVKKDFIEMWWIPAIIGGLGILLILSPDTIVRGANKGVDKYMGKDEKKDA